MEQRLQVSVQEYMERWKTDLQRKAVALNFSEKEKVKELLEFVFHYPKYNVSSSGGGAALTSSSTSGTAGSKRKHNPTMLNNGGSGGGATTTQGLHRDEKVVAPIEVHGLYLYPTDIQGIFYYLDSHDNVYLPDDVERRSTKPRILGKLVRADRNEIDLELSMIQVKPEYQEFFRQWTSSNPVRTK